MNDYELTEEERQQFALIAQRLGPTQEGLSGTAIKRFSVRLNLPGEILARIWALIDADKDGFISEREFCVFMKLVRNCMKNIPPPQILPDSLASYIGKPTLLDCEYNPNADSLSEIFVLPPGFVPDSQQQSLMNEINEKLKAKKTLKLEIDKQEDTNRKLETRLENLRKHLAKRTVEYQEIRKKEIILIAEFEKAKAEGTFQRI